MFKFKRKQNNTKDKLHKAISSFISDLLRKCGDALKLSRKIRIANIWARKHPKRLFTYYLSFAIILFCATVVSDFVTFGESKEKSLDFSGLPSMSHRIRNIFDTDYHNTSVKAELNMLGLKGMELYNELDSMMKIPNKTHLDSVKIIATYNILNKTFNIQQNESQSN